MSGSSKAWIAVAFALGVLGFVAPTEAALVKVVVSGVYQQTNSGPVPAGLVLEPGVTPMETTFIYDTDAISETFPGFASGGDAIISMQTTIGDQTFRLERSTGSFGRVNIDQYGPTDEWQYLADMFGTGITEPNFIAVYMAYFLGSGAPYVPYVPADDAPFSPPVNPGSFFGQVLSFDPTPISYRDGIEGSILTVSATVVPIPAAVWLFASAFGGLAALGRRSAKEPPHAFR